MSSVMLGTEVRKKRKNKQGNSTSRGPVFLSIDCREIPAPLWFLLMRYMVPGAPPPPSFSQPWCSQDCFLLLFSLLFCLCAILYSFFKAYSKVPLSWLRDTGVLCGGSGPFKPAGNGCVYHRAAPILFSKRPCPQSPPPLWSSPVVPCKPNAVVFQIQLIANAILNECGTTILGACFPWKVRFVDLPTSNTAIFQVILCF